ncbi:hypothetical protein [Gracilibacillus alcaliphilus]|uniref:hypothetical protein n=1 Tax=Gracilibacillus alcaliphilus TaxID=1401441 RepID=UPI00195DEB8E|nr:hypothetical protein [Gracilibacillus alcaliphilus]MBM7675387.1 hypothetical protein [Gracilibacillus alcaliphilus]
MNLTLISKKFGVESFNLVTARPDVSVYKGRSNDKTIAMKIHQQEESFNREIKSLNFLYTKDVRVPQIIITLNYSSIS